MFSTFRGGASPLSPLANVCVTTVDPSLYPEPVRSYLPPPIHRWPKGGNGGNSSPTTHFLFCITYELLRPLCTMSPPQKSSKTRGHLCSPSLAGLAAGTLLYVALFEVLDRERKSKSLPGMAVLAFFVLGWTAMLMLDLFVTEPEEEEEEEVEAPEDEADARVFYSRLKKLSRLIQSVVN